MTYKRKEVIGDCTLYLGDCMEILPTLGKVDAVVTDPPYGTTGCKWDSVIPLGEMWEQIRRVTSPKSPVVLTASQPFTSVLVTSNLKEFRCEWIWQKNAGSNFAATRWVPMKEHESLLVFGRAATVYNPIKQPRARKIKTGYTNKSNTGKREAYGGLVNKGFTVKDGNMRVPSSVQKFNRQRGLHPTQKPVDLMAYMVKTYSNEGGLILDFTMGSGTTGVACVQLGRRFIGIEIDETYFDIACERIRQADKQGDLL